MNFDQPSPVFKGAPFLLNQIQIVADLLEKPLNEGRKLPVEIMISNLQHISDFADQAEDAAQDQAGGVLTVIDQIQGLAQLMTAAAKAGLEIPPAVIINNLGLASDLAHQALELISA